VEIGNNTRCVGIDVIIREDKLLSEPRRQCSSWINNRIVFPFNGHLLRGQHCMYLADVLLQSTTINHAANITKDSLQQACTVSA
jgi:hypothetical protein